MTTAAKPNLFANLLYPGGLSVLVVDDFSTMRRIVGGLLKEFTSATVDEAENGKDALDKLKSGNKYDLVISDISMPKKNGFELLQEARANGIETPFLMMTADVSRDSILQARQSGAQGYIVKPFTGENLREKVEKIMAQSQEVAPAPLLPTSLRDAPTTMFGQVAAKAGHYISLGNTVVCVATPNTFGPSRAFPFTELKALDETIRQDCGFSQRRTMTTVIEGQPTLIYALSKHEQLLPAFKQPINAPVA